MKSIISFFTAIVATITMLWNTAMTKVDPDGLRYIALNAAKSYFISQTNDEVEALKEKTGGFMKGVCHPNENYEQIKNANIEWVRFD